MQPLTSETHAPSEFVEDDYLKLIYRFPLRPIRDDAELDRAMVVFDSLFLRGDDGTGRDDLNEAEAGYFDTLTLLIQSYAERDCVENKGGLSPSNG